MTGSGAQLTFCVPPITAAATGSTAFGELVWNAGQLLRATATAAVPTADAHPGSIASKKTVRKFPATGTIQAQAVTECLGASDPDGCVCNSVKSCAEQRRLHRSTNCLKIRASRARVDYVSARSTRSILGVCGAVNQNWTNANDQIKTGNNNYISIFKAACPSAYSYQFDDTSSGLELPEHRRSVSEL